ncbi:hypothetical protein Vretimale_17133 [Volvox reticuliferus]|uniref:Uncharacterized protein n=1 Tax=Volvox reticuliferus TaxID=1737510 RepID=A0A8J4CW40_9CHLO|nr:hypothetical protein Vretifemale_18614 [Volvox reticuliferus]GIM14104.1 hypothetical protein Vretimale_17133 [Volvox reticuliferus]
MADSHKPHAAGGREAGSPSHTNSPKRPPLASLSRHRATAYCAHAPDPYAAMASQGDWSTELWDIFAQPGGPNMCCLSLWCPCIQYGLLLEQLPPGSVMCAGSAAGGCALFCVLWLLGDLLGAALLTKVFTLPCTAFVHMQIRGYIRRKYGIQSHPIHDFFITWCCAPCALCQEAREAVIRQAAEREDQARTPLLMSRSGSVHDKADVSARSSLAGRASSGLVPLGSAHEPMSPGSSAAAPATATASHGGTGIGISEAPSPAALARTSQAYGGQGNQATSPATPNRTSTRAGAVADVVNANVSDGAVSAATAVAAGARMDPAPASANGGDLAAVDVASVLGRS